MRSAERRKLNASVESRRQKILQDVGRTYSQPANDELSSQTDIRVLKY